MKEVLSALGLLAAGDSLAAPSDGFAELPTISFTPPTDARKRLYNPLSPPFASFGGF